MPQQADGHGPIFLTATDYELPEVLPEGIEKYKNFAEMTRGGSGILRSCFDQLTGRSVVMKSLLPQFVDDDVLQDASHPCPEVALRVVAVQIHEDLHKGQIHPFRRLISVFGIAKRHGHQIRKMLPMQLVLSPPVSALAPRKQLQIGGGVTHG